MALQIGDTTGLVLVDLSAGSKTIRLPSISRRPGRAITIKDELGFALNNPLTIQVSDTNNESFETGQTVYTCLLYTSDAADE